MGKDTREQSRRATTTEIINFNALNCGSLQRIADATELMASNYIALQNERDKYKRWFEEESAIRYKMAKRMAALSGVITKLKKKAQNGR